MFSLSNLKILLKPQKKHFWVLTWENIRKPFEAEKILFPLFLQGLTLVEKELQMDLQGKEKNLKKKKKHPLLFTGFYLLLQ